MDRKEEHTDRSDDRVNGSSSSSSSTFEKSRSSEELYKGALEGLEEVLERKKKLLGPDHSSTSMTAKNLDMLREERKEG